MNNAFNEKMFDKQVAYNKEMYQQQLGDQWKFYNDSKQNAWDLVANQQQFQTDMWNKNNEYNSASAQRERFEAAGLNPYMMMNGGSAGTAQTMSGSAGAAPPAVLHLRKVLHRLPLPPTLLTIPELLPDLVALLMCCYPCPTAR